MRHLNDSSAVDLAEGRGDEQASQHLAGCERCQQRVATFADLLKALDCSQEPLAEVPPYLMAWAAACARTVAGPVLRAKRRPRTRVLELLAFGAQPIAAVRGGAAVGAAALFGDHRHQIDLQVDPGGDGPSLHGQIVPLDTTEINPWQVVVVCQDGSTYNTTSDSDGEFLIPELGSWDGLSLIADSGEERLLVPHLGDGAKRKNG